MTEIELKDRIASLLQDRPAKVWLTRQQGHRLDFVWSVGDAQLKKEELIAHIGCHFLLGQQVPADVKGEVVAAFNTFASDHAANAKPGDGRAMRFRRG
jgi:hypothetical protein